MLARENDALMIPVIGTGFEMIKEGVISSMVIRNDALPRLELVTALVRESTILALVSVQEAGCAAPVAEGPFLSFWLGQGYVGSGRVRE
jgi:hypothetical protein